ncbi:MAG: AAA family ATPase, partial [Gammaproteobacteria bacterium]|nr:AAA family ATPase [Gammaproteobacteria bacterium]
MEWVSDEKLDYQEHFGLEREPFSAEVDQASFFNDSEISQRIGMIQHYSRYSDLLLLVTGEPGSGKTTLLNHFASLVDNELYISRVSARSSMSPDDLLIAISKGYQLPPVMDNSIHSFIRQVQEMVRGEDGAVLLVDDAHLLSAESLTFLIKLAEVNGPHGKLLRVILFAEPSIQQTLAQPGLVAMGESISHTMELPLLDAARTESYIHHRMQSAGFDGDTPFTRSVVKHIYKSSHGNIAQINQLAGEHLLYVLNNPGKSLHPTGKLYIKAIAAMLLLALAVTGFLSREQWLNSETTIAEALAPRPTQDPQPKTPMPLPPGSAADGGNRAHRIVV